MRKEKSFYAGFIKRAVRVVINYLDQENFSGNELAEELSLSREQTHRKLKQNINLPTGKFIRYIRLLQACVYLIEGNDSIAEISFKVGFSSPSYFNKCFKKGLGVTPGDLRKMGITRQVANKKILSFYSRPEMKKILRSNGIHLELPEQGKMAGNRSSKKVLLTAGIPLLLFVMVLSFLLTRSPDGRDLADLVENQRIAVIPFTNQTRDSSMAQIGDIASSWISSQLDDLDGVQTVPYFTITQYQPYMGILPNDPQNRPTFREVVGAQYFITGNYFLKDQHLYFDAQLADAYTQESVYNLSVVEGPKDSVMQVIEDLRLKIAGLVTNLEGVKLGKLNPPNYEAYKYYLNGIEEMNVGLLHPSNALQYFEKATELEPEFVMPQIFTTWFYYGEKRDSVIQRISEISNITEYERNVSIENDHLFKRNYQEALRISLQSLKDYPQDYYFNMIASHRTSAQFMPRLAIKILSQLPDPLNNDVGSVWHHYKMRNYFESLIMLGKHEEALAYLESVPVAYHNLVTLELFINANVKIGKSREEVEALIENFDLKEEHLFPVYYTSAAYEFGLTSQKETSLYFARKALELFQSIPEVMPPHEVIPPYIFDMADALYLSGDLTGAKTYLEKQLEENPANDDLLVYLAQVEASLGNVVEAEQILAQMENRLILWRRNNLEYEVDYLKARMYALLGEKEEAVELLKKALAKGQLRHHYDFERDIFLKSLFDYPPFQSQVQPKEYSDITAVP